MPLRSDNKKEGIASHRKLHILFYFVSKKFQISEAKFFPYNIRNFKDVAFNGWVHD